MKTSIVAIVFALVLSAVLSSESESKNEIRNLPVLVVTSMACIDHQGGAYSVSSADPKNQLVCENQHCVLPAGTELTGYEGKVEDLNSPAANALADLLRPIVSGISCTGNQTIYRLDSAVVICSAPMNQEDFDRENIKNRLAEFLIDSTAAKTESTTR
jgi:hypothetical protein